MTTPSPRVIAGTNGTVQGLNALKASLERGNTLIEAAQNKLDATKVAPDTFTIHRYQLENMYHSFKHTYEPIFGGQDKKDGYNLANTIAFNAFKIFFQNELNALGLDTTREL
jgi:hypothetical protein